MKLYIPELGEILVLEKDWTFKLVLERRNDDLIQYVYPQGATHWNYQLPLIKELYPESNGYFIETQELRELLSSAIHSMYRNTESFITVKKLYGENRDKLILGNELKDVTFPAGTELKVDRIYIRKGAKDFSSVSFHAKLPGKKKGFRFFAKLADVNTIEYKS